MRPAEVWRPAGSGRSVSPHRADGWRAPGASTCGPVPDPVPRSACQGAAPVGTLGPVRRILAAAMVAALALGVQLRAHEIPNEVTVQTFLKPEGGPLTFLVRAPLKAMRDVDVPVRENGFLDLARVQPTLEDAAMLWIGDFVELFENGQPLAGPRITAARVSLPSDKSFASFEEAQAHLAGPRAARGHHPLLAGRAARRRLRLRHPVGSVALRHPPGADPARPAGQRRDAAHHRPATPSAPSTSTATRASSSSTRAGTRRRCASPRTASSTSSTASTTCCSCSAWSSRSAGCGRWSPS